MPLWCASARAESGQGCAVLALRTQCAGAMVPTHPAPARAAAPAVSGAKKRHIRQSHEPRSSKSARTKSLSQSRQYSTDDKCQVTCQKRKTLFSLLPLLFQICIFVSRNVRPRHSHRRAHPRLPVAALRGRLGGVLGPSRADRVVRRQTEPNNNKVHRAVAHSAVEAHAARFFSEHPSRWRWGLSHCPGPL